LGEPCRAWLASQLAAGVDRPRTVAAIGPSAFCVTVCRAAAVALVVYCGTLAVGLWWRISVAEARYAERLRIEVDKRPAHESEPPAAPPVERSSGRVEHAYRGEESYCGEER
jgi:hypothetical protein